MRKLFIHRKTLSQFLVFVITIVALSYICLNSSWKSIMAITKSNPDKNEYRTVAMYDKMKFSQIQSYLICIDSALIKEMKNIQNPVIRDNYKNLLLYKKIAIDSPLVLEIKQYQYKLSIQDTVDFGYVWIDYLTRLKKRAFENSLIIPEECSSILE